MYLANNANIDPEGYIPSSIVHTSASTIHSERAQKRVRKFRGAERGIVDK